MRISLPYRFDTSYIGTLIFKAAAWLEALLLLGLVVKLVTGDYFQALAVLLLLLFVGGFAWVIFRKAGGSTGIITASHITVEPVRLYGFRTTGPQGRFRIAEFKSICVEWRPRVGEPGVQMSPGTNESVYLLGKDSTPDVEIARLTDENGRAFAHDLSELLSLPIEERPAPGVHGSRN